MKINPIKIDRIAAWLLLVLMILFIVSGYGMTKGIISYQLASAIHLDYLPYLLVLVFSIHTFCAIRLAFMRWKIWKPWTKYCLLAAYIIFAGGIVYIGSFYQPVAVNAQNDLNGTTNQTITAPSAPDKTFTLTELAKYNGRGGQPAYVAVDGLVYDLSVVFKGGVHQGYSAGQDLSAVFHRQHVTSTLVGFPIVGKLQ